MSKSFKKLIKIYSSTLFLRIYGIFILCIIVLSIPLTVFLVQQQQDVRNRAQVVGPKPWPMPLQNVHRNNRSPYVGPRDKNTVQRLWEFRQPSNVGAIGSTSFVGTTVGENNTVYFSAGMTGIWAVDKGANPQRPDRYLWHFTGGNSGQLARFIQYAPTIARDGLLYFVNESGYLYALKPDGSTLWTAQFQGIQAHTSVTISPDDRLVLFTYESGYVVAYDRLTGGVDEQNKLGNPVWKTQVVNNNSFGTGRRIPIVYDSAGNYYGTINHRVFSLAPDGRIRWTQDFDFYNNVFTTGPAMSDDEKTLYFVQGSKVFAVSNLNDESTNSHLKWVYTLYKRPGEEDTAMTRNPSLGPDGTIYIGTKGDNDSWKPAPYGGWVFAIKDDNTQANLKWKKLFPTIGVNGGVKSDIIVDAAGTLFFMAGQDTKGDGSANSPYRLWAVDSSKAVSDSQNNVDPISSAYNYNDLTNSILWSSPGYFSNDEYPGQQLSIDSDGTLYAPLGKAVAAAFRDNNSVPPPTTTPTSISSQTPTSTQLTSAPTPQTTSNGVMFGAWVGITMDVFGDRDRFEQAVGIIPKVRHFYYSNRNHYWQKDYADPYPPKLTHKVGEEAVGGYMDVYTDPVKFKEFMGKKPLRDGEILMLSFATDDLKHAETADLNKVADGSADNYVIPFLESWADELAALSPHEVWVRPFWEDNGSWYWWKSTGREATYKKAFCHVKDIVKKRVNTKGVDNVKFVWSPNKGTNGNSYPGDSCVDIIGFDGYPATQSSLKSTYDTLVKIADAASPKKTMIIAETGTNFGSDNDMNQMKTFFGSLTTWAPRISAVVWWNEDHSMADPVERLADPKYKNAFCQAVRPYVGLGNFPCQVTSTLTTNPTQSSTPTTNPTTTSQITPTSGPKPTTSGVTPPNAPIISVNVNCINDNYAGNGINISWTNNSNAVNWVDISSNNFSTYYNKSVNGLTSTTAPNGFKKNGSTELLKINPGTIYSVRLYNGAHSQIRTFSVQNRCAANTPTTVVITAPTTIPTIVLPSPSSGDNGLTGRYYTGTYFNNLVLTRIDPNINFDWGWQLSFDPSVRQKDYFSIRWIGYIIPQVTGTYTFYTNSDDGVRLWINGQMIINKWLNQPAREWSATASLTAGQKYPIRLDYYENQGFASIKLYWSGPNTPKQIIPQNQLFTR